MIRTENGCEVIEVKALSFGEILWDIYPDERFIGGAPLNFAAHLARHGGDISMLSAVGNDPWGAETLVAVRRLGIGGKYLAVSAGKQTGRCLVTLSEDGTPSYDLLQDVAYDYIRCDGLAESFDLLYFGTLALRSGYNLHTLERLLAENAFGEIFVDVNIRLPFCSAEVLSFCVENATVLKVSTEELPTVLELLGMALEDDPPALMSALAQRFPKLKLFCSPAVKTERGAMTAQNAKCIFPRLNR